MTFVSRLLARSNSNPTTKSLIIELLWWNLDASSNFSSHVISKARYKLTWKRRQTIILWRFLKILLVVKRHPLNCYFLCYDCTKVCILCSYININRAVKLYAIFYIWCVWIGNINLILQCSNINCGIHYSAYNLYL